MKIQAECVPCLLKRVLFEAEQLTDDPKITTRVIREACKMLSDQYDPSKCSAMIATQVHKRTYEILDTPDPYDKLKMQANAEALSLVPRVEALIEKAQDPLKTSMLCSIVGNMMDFGIAGASDDPSLLSHIFDKMYAEGLGYDDTEQIKDILKQASKVVLFTDNCGEIVFDKIFCRELKRFHPAMHLTLIVKGEPVLSDATMEDAKTLGFSEVVDDIMTTGCFAVGVDFKHLPQAVEKTLKQADIILCKGMANYESFSETQYRPIAYFMRTKCDVIARSMGLPRDINVVKLYS
jgi:uncharacterized protein with ATP-grasp and redox domains